MRELPTNFLQRTNPFVPASLHKQRNDQRRYITNGTDGKITARPSWLCLWCLLAEAPNAGNSLLYVDRRRYEILKDRVSISSKKKRRATC